MNPSSTQFVVACAQTNPVFGDVSGNLDRQRVLLTRAVAAGAKLIVFPECSTTGWVFESRAEAEAVAEEIAGDGPAMQAWLQWARESKVHIVAGIVERDGEDLFNTAVLIGPDGHVGSYRKLHTWGLERDVYCPGDLDVGVFETPLGRIAMSICYDVWFPEVARMAAVKGTDILCVPANWVPIPGQPSDVPTMANMLCLTQAHTNLLYVAGASRVGVERGQRFIGTSIIVDHSGFALAGPASGTDEELITASIDPVGSREERLRNPFNQPLGDRRIDVYGTPPGGPRSTPKRDSSRL
jgi:predicted amidohydrolase